MNTYVVGTDGSSTAEVAVVRGFPDEAARHDWRVRYGPCADAAGALASWLPQVFRNRRVPNAYAAELVRPEGLEGRVHQLTVSPLHNQAPHPIRVGFKIGWSRAARRITERLARLVKARPTELRWEKQAGPFFGNQIGELVLDGRGARFLLSVAEIGDDFAFGQEQNAGFQRVFEDEGGKIVQKLWPPLNAPDYGTYVSQLKSDLDGIFMSFAGSNGLRFFKAFKMRTD